MLAKKKKKSVPFYFLPVFESIPVKDPNHDPRTDQMICGTPVRTCTAMEEFKT